MAATLALAADSTNRHTVATRHLFCPKYGLKISEVHTISTIFEPRDWRFPIIDYVMHYILPNDPKEATFIRQRSLHFYYDSKVKILYRCSYDGILLHFLSNLEAQEVLREAHNGIYGAH